MRRNTFRLPRKPTSVRLARSRVRDHMFAWGRGRDTVDTVVLVVSELVTNAVRHVSSPDREFEVTVTVLADGSCVVEVSDPEQRLPVIRDAEEGDESGRGLRLVEALTDAWGVRHRGRFGKTVWAVLATPADGDGS